MTAAQEELWRYALVVGIGGSALALLVGLFILRQGLQPLDRILSRVREIRGRNLTIRIPEERRPQELQQLADTLNEMFQQLDTAFKTREAFIASISHDLRTPLTVLQGQIDVLLMNPAMGEDAKQRLSTMGKEIQRLTRMTNNLLLNAQLESKPVLIAGDVDLRELVEEVAREVQPLAQDIVITVSTPDIIVVSGDFDMIKQMVLNVVDNAIKFTPKGGKVALALTDDERFATIKVADTGPGISPENLAQIGRPFIKTGAANKSSRGGTGLGLAIVKQVVKIHNGQMDVDSQKGVGTTITLRLPLKTDSPDI